MIGPAQQRSRRKAIAALVIVNVLWGSSFPVMRSLNLSLDQHFGVTEETASAALRLSTAAWMIAIRFGLALILLLVLLRGIVRRVRWPHFGAGCALGAVFYCGLMLQVMGLATIPASRSGFLTSLTVVFTPIIMTIWRRRLPRVPVVLAAIVALAGVSVLTGWITVNFGRVKIADHSLVGWGVGDLLTVAGAVVFSFQILLIDWFGKRYDAEAFTPSMFATTALLGTLTFWFSYRLVSETTAAQASHSVTWVGLASQPPLIMLIAFLCVFPSLLAFHWMNKYQPMLSAGQAAVLYTTEPLFASLWAMVLPAQLSVLCTITYANESFSTPLVIGGALVLSANVLALWPSADAMAGENQASTDRDGGLDIV
tara:strand:- start:316031 stop:317137 length:1107 start_codon:yes stop_codon:yes gene_type:complete